MTTPDWKNRLYFGDNLDILREHTADESVDLIYLDPPFNSNATYNVLFQEKSGQDSAAQITAFDDTWHWGWEAEAAYRGVATNGPEKLGRLLGALREFLGQSDMLAYLTMMAQRLAELHRVLKPTGSIYLHCDPTASHYLKLLLDAVFGAKNFRNEIVWKRTYAHGSSHRYGPVHDILLFYSKSDQYVWTGLKGKHDPEYISEHFNYFEEDTKRLFQPITLTGSGVRHGDSGKPWRDIDPTKAQRHWALPGAVVERLGIEGSTVQEKLDALDAAGMIHWPRREGGVPRLKWYADELEGTALPDIWVDVRRISARASERLGYPTQKPEALLERIINASSNEGDLVLDPFCGCGTAVAVAERLNRRWIGIDITHLAISLMKTRLRDSFGEYLRPYQVIGVPQDAASARALAVESEHDGRYQFEWWALGLVEARPAQERKKGADSGIDGYINFFDDNSGKAKRAIVQVKSGHVNRGQIATLKGDIGREQAELGLFITLEPPSRPMQQEATAAGFYEPEHFPGHQYPRVQLLTIEDLLEGRAAAQYPRFAPQATFRQAPRRRRKPGSQSRMV